MERMVVRRYRAGRLAASNSPCPASPGLKKLAVPSGRQKPALSMAPMRKGLLSTAGGIQGLRRDGVHD